MDVVARHRHGGVAGRDAAVTGAGGANACHASFQFDDDQPGFLCSPSTLFDVPLANTINTAAGSGIYGDTSHAWTLTNEGHVTGWTSGIVLLAPGLLS